MPVRTATKDDAYKIVNLFCPSSLRNPHLNARRAKFTDAILDEIFSPNIICLVFQDFELSNNIIGAAHWTRPSSSHLFNQYAKWRDGKEKEKEKERVEMMERWVESMGEREKGILVEGNYYRKQFLCFDRSK